MTKVDVQYLEHKAIAEAKKANAFVLSDNKQIPKAPNLPEHQQDSMNEFFEDVKFLASLSVAIFLKYHNPKKNIYSTPKVEDAMQKVSTVPMDSQS